MMFRTGSCVAVLLLLPACWAADTRDGLLLCRGNLLVWHGDVAATNLPPLQLLLLLRRRVVLLLPTHRAMAGGVACVWGGQQ
jgi:hypothetical protein